MERREVLKLVALVALAPKLNALESAACAMEGNLTTSPPRDYKLQFFTEDENKFVDQLMEMIIPADDHSPGARAAKASLFADQMIATGDDALKKQWRDGLALIREQAKNSSIDDLLHQAAENEEDPKTNLDHFFLSLKRMTVNGYYTSDIGIHQELEYAGNTYVPRFPECTHPEHRG